MNTDPPGKSPFSKREWILLIIVVCVLQSLIHFVSWRFAASDHALGYVSFAGTIISIILALLAIVYTYFQSAEQSRMSSSVAIQLSRLNEVVTAFEKSSAQLSSELDQLGALSEGISKSVRLSEDVHKQFTQVHTTLGELKDLATQPKASPEAATKKISSGVAGFDQPTLRLLARQMQSIARLMPFAVHVGAKHKLKSSDEILAQLIWPVFLHDFGKDPGREFYQFVHGYFSGSIRAIDSQIVDGKNSISLAENFATEIIACVGTALPDGGSWEMLRSHLLKNLSSQKILTAVETLGPVTTSLANQPPATEK